MKVESDIYPSRPFRPRYHATLPNDRTKSGLLTLVFTIAHRIGLNATDLTVLRRIAQKTRAADYADPTRSPVCFERQIDMAASIGLSAPQWRKIEQKLERLRLIARETAANGYRGRVSGSSGLESCAGLSLEPLIARLDELVAIEARQVEATERLAMCRLEISKARREIKRLASDLGDHPLVGALSDECATWASPRAYTTLAVAQTHLESLERVVENLKESRQSSSNMIGAAIADERCHKQNTIETNSESCRMPKGPEESLEKKRGAPDAGVNEEFLACLSVAKLRDLASDDLRFYIDHAPGGGGPTTISDIDWAVLQRLRDLGINASAFEEAVEVMGWLRAMLSVMVIDRNRGPSDPADPQLRRRAAGLHQARPLRRTRPAGQHLRHLGAGGQGALRGTPRSRSTVADLQVRDADGQADATTKNARPRSATWSWSCPAFGSSAFCVEAF